MGEPFSTRRQIKLTDAAGVEHDYSMTLHPAVPGTDLLLRLLSCAGEPLGTILSMLVGMAGGAEETEDGKVAVDVSALANADLQKAGPALAQLSASILKEGGVKLFREVMDYTVRDGKKLSDDNTFNEAYRGNPGEMFAAFAWCVIMNWGAIITGPFGRLMDVDLSG